MIADLKPYPEYKESGLPWLGQVPEHWEVKRAKSIFHRIDQRSQTGKEELLTVSSARGIVPRKTASVTMFKAESYLGYKLCWPGDLVINSLWAWAGGLGVSNHHGIISSAYGVYRIRHNAAMTPAFVHEVVRSSSFNWELKVRSKGVWISRLQLTDVSFLNAPMHIPPLAEQAAIVRFLDWANGRLKRAIRAKRKVIALLMEQKQAIINRAITRGLDPNVPLKSSGIDWLGDIPENWQVCRLRNVVSQVTSGSRGWSSYAADEGPLFLRIANLRRVSLQLRFDDVIRLNLPETSEAQRTQVKGGDILVSITAYIGSIAVVPSDLEEAYISQHVALCRPRDDRHNPLWLGYVLLSEVGQTHGRLSLYGGTKDGLSLDDVKNYPLLLPPRDEQDKLVEQIELQLESTETAIDRAQREIDLIREYRTRLVSDVVTGKLDVREAATHLPEEITTDTIEDVADEIDEIEPSDEETAE